MKRTNLNKKCGFIPQLTYERIVKCLPIVSVEALIVSEGRLLFLRRKNEPAKGEWWFPGGRLRRGESLKKALCREVAEETGLEIVYTRFIGVYSRVFPERHDITIAYLCKCKEGIVRLNDEHSEYAFFSRNPDGLHPFLAETIYDSIWNKDNLHTETMDKGR
jgi:colanic acid biosynthesis protein WcaH